MRFKVKSRIIKCIDIDNNYTNPPIGDNADYEASFTFDEEWDGHIKTARFIHGDKYVERILEDDKCLIPVEVLKYGYLKVGVFTAKMTTTQCEVFVRPSIKELHGATIEPTPDVYAQIIKMIENINVQVSDEQIEKAVAKYMEEHPIVPPVVVTLENITATKEKTEYNVGDVFDSTDIIVIAHYSDGTTKDVTSNLVIDTVNVNMDEAGSYTIGISYTENNVTKITSINIAVSLVVPQTGTWQLKNTTGKKYIMFSTDDDNMGNAKFARLLRTYGFPYTMNVEAENASINKDLGTDVDDTIFTDSDAPALFPNGVDVVAFGKYLHDNNLGEVSQHGSSGKVLWDSEKLTGDYLTSIHTEYVKAGGTKTEEELRTAIMEQLSDTDGSQGAVYVDNSRKTLEELYEFNIYTAGIWGGVPIATIDGIDISLNAIKGTDNYNWRQHNYSAVSSVLGNGFKFNISTYDISRDIKLTTDECNNIVDSIECDKICELFWHAPFSDIGADNLRSVFDYVKSLVDSGKAEVVTRKQYAQLGEWVDNPVIKITVSRDSIPLGEVDSESAYTVTAIYKDGATANVSSEAILDTSNINTEEIGIYTVEAFYRGFKATSNVAVIRAGYTIPEGLKNTSYWFIAVNETQGKMIAGNTTGAFGSAGESSGIFTFFNCTDGYLNGWVSTDDGTTWTQVNTNNVHYKTIKTNTASGYNFGSVSNDTITFVETSGNFEITY